MVDPELELRQARSRRPRRPPWRPMGFPWRSTLFAGLFSVAFLAVAPTVAFRGIDILVPGIWSVSPIAPSAFSTRGVLDAILASALFSALALTATMAQLQWGWPDRAVALLAFPAAWAVVLPSALADMPSWPAWLTLGTLAALAFDLHWLIFCGAREALD
ncbi:hypothetical protein OJF2_09600 [Aquisphaera giovannonii]|uniref:Uncharacterized protein n=1 Tax=Aquisphaera giovannonii TaxID=406548 RepID=A0A5B9VVV7_9BACT|nr:hypothetical protein [Aquisphaera giovannonii]QEH32483.1 hypothetical protein OJF2_09600 [Aquisphaera giovannonii]